MRDPITVIHEALEDIVDNDTVLQGLIRPGGRCRFVRRSNSTDKRDHDPRPAVINESNSPTLMLSLSNLTFQDFRDNMSGVVDVYFTWQISCSQHLLDIATYPVIVALFKAVRSNLLQLRQLQIECRDPEDDEDPEDVPKRVFVEDVELNEGMADQPQIGMNFRGPVVEGWQTILQLKVTLTI